MRAELTRFSTRSASATRPDGPLSRRSHGMQKRLSVARARLIKPERGALIEALVETYGIDDTWAGEALDTFLTALAERDLLAS